jgi:site-specific DNA recombinase
LSPTVWLNERGYRARLGGIWGTSTVHKILTNPVYGGEARFNRLDTRKRRVKDETEQVRTEVPAIIPQAEFARIHAVTGPILLTGVAFCASCAGAMTLRTGTSRTGVVHHYYACSTCGRKGKTACKGRSIRMDRLDSVVTETVAGQLLHPERIAEMLSLLAGRRAERAAAVDERIGRLEKEASLGQERLQRLYRLVEDGLAELDDLLKERIASLKAERERAVAALERARSASRPEIHISSALIERFAQTMREKLCFDEIPMRKAYLSSIVDRVEVDDGLVRIMGPKDAIEQGVRQAANPPEVVRSFIHDGSPTKSMA